MPDPESATITRTEPRIRRTASLITSPERVCWIAFSSSASTARPRRSPASQDLHDEAVEGDGLGPEKVGILRRGDQQQLLGEALEPGQLADHDVDVTAVPRVGEAAREQLRVAEGDRDRGLELMGGVLQEPALGR